MKPSHQAPGYSNLNTKTVLGVFRQRKAWMDQPDRRIRLNVPDLQLGDNSITTTKYNLANFLPVNLYEQFSKLANVYFLVDLTH